MIHGKVGIRTTESCTGFQKKKNSGDSLHGTITFDQMAACVADVPDGSIGGTKVLTILFCV